jgi:hypothetical protein
MPSSISHKRGQPRLEFDASAGCTPAMFDPNAFFTFGRAAIYGLIALLGSTVAIRQSATFRRRWYWWILLIAIGNALLAAFVYIWMTSYSVSLADAALLWTYHAGSWRVAERYSIVIGVAVSGLIGFRLSRRLKRDGP